MEHTQQKYCSPEDCVSIAEAAKLLPYSEGYLRLLVRTGKIEAVKVSSRKTFIRRSAINRILSQHSSQKGVHSNAAQSAHTSTTEQQSDPDDILAGL